MKNRLFILGGLCMLSTLATGCLKEFRVKPMTRDSSAYFDFKTTQATALSIDYCFPQDDYVILAEIYDQNPLTENENGEWIKKEIEPLYRAATNGSGKLAALTQIPAHLTTVWLHSDYPGVLSPIEIEVKDNRIAFNQNAYIEAQRQLNTRAVTPNKHTYPDGWSVLGDWDSYGTPSYLDAEMMMPSSATLYKINELFVKHSNIKLKDRHPEYFKAGVTSEIHIIKPTKLFLVFVNSTAAWNNTVGYFTFPTGQEPEKLTDVKRIVAFPSATPFMRILSGVATRGAMVGGERVQLKYWDGEKFHEEFPAGISIGWWLEGMGFNAQANLVPPRNPPTLYSRFSIDRLNGDGERRAVALRDSKSDRVVAIAFEDNIDLRYNDATFYLHVDQGGAIDDNIPVLPDDGSGPADDQNYIKTDGFLMYEDLWPHAGDYDMNDVMVKYSTKVYKHILNNSVYKIETEYTPVHRGGVLLSGFGVQFTGVSNEVVRKVTIDGVEPSSYMEGKMLEPGQSFPTIILFDDLTTVLNKKITLTVDLNDTPESTVKPPFNPFIFAESDKMRGKEVHLVKYMPTDKADPSFFGKGKDGSNPQTKLYYVMSKNTKQYPFALNMPYMQHIPIPKESTNIDISYPKFRSWVESDGKLNKDWYLFPATK